MDRRSGFYRTLPGALAILLVAVGCTIALPGGGGGQDPAPQDRNFDVPYDEVWNAAIAALGELDLPISTLEKESGVLATDWILLDGAGTFMECDGDVRSEEGRYNVLVRQVTGGTQVRITTSYRAIAETGAAAVRCGTTGEMERRILGRVEERVQRRGG